MHFNQIQSEFDHFNGRMVNYNDTLLTIGGGRLEGQKFSDFHGNAKVEHFAGQKWSEHDMSPVNGLDSLYAFTALSIDSYLYIFGNFQ